MLRDEEIQINTGRSSNGSFMRMIHIPTGIERVHPGSLQGVNQHELKQQWLAEIEAELVANGLTQYIVGGHFK